MNKLYNSLADTKQHIQKVNSYIRTCIKILEKRGAVHDASKIVTPEKPLFDRYTPLLANTTYGSKEYESFLSELKPALDHHYANNSHHPEHYENGIDDMSLFDVIEMLMDWRAAGERHNDGDINKSLDINTTRFNISPQLANILKNTINELDW